VDHRPSGRRGTQWPKEKSESNQSEIIPRRAQFKEAMGASQGKGRGTAIEREKTYYRGAG